MAKIETFTVHIHRYKFACLYRLSFPSITAFKRFPIDMPGPSKSPSASCYWRP
jgi:hypothetical protein